MGLLIFLSLTLQSLSLDESESLNDDSDESSFVHFRQFFFLPRLFLLYYLYLLSLDESDFLDDKSDDDGSDSRSSGTCYSPLRFDNSFGRVSVLGSGIFIPIGIESNCDVFVFVVFVSIGVESKGG